MYPPPRRVKNELVVFSKVLIKIFTVHNANIKAKMEKQWASHKAKMEMFTNVGFNYFAGKGLSPSTRRNSSIIRRNASPDFFGPRSNDEVSVL